VTSRTAISASSPAHRLGRQRPERRQREPCDLAVMGRSRHAADFTMAPMASWRGPRTALALVLALALGGCKTERAPVPVSCSGGAQAIAHALRRAPAAVTLAGATKLSTCVSRSRTDAELQTLGSTLLAVADGFKVHATSDGTAALRLGYLVGATRRGVAANPGVAAQMGRRIEQSTRLDGASAATRAALQRGLKAGEQSG